MKKLYFLGAALLCTTLSAQNLISFETSEGYQLGDIRNQNSWSVTDDGEGNFIQNQVVSSEKSTVGTNSFKNAYEAEYGAQFYPIIGAQKSFDQPLDFQDTTVSFDVYVTEIDGSNFEMAAYGIDSNEDFTPVYDIAFDYTGSLNVVTSVDFDMVETGVTWQPNQWYNVKVKVSATEIKYFLNNALIFTTPNFSQLNLVGMNFLHDNYSGDAYIDNIQINPTNMAVSSVNKEKIAVYPNPVKNSLNFSLPNGEKISHISIHNIAGQTVLDKNISDATINLEHLKTGTYILTVTNSKGVSYSSKFIKE